MIDVVSLGLDMVAGVLAQQQPNEPGPEFGKASPFGLLVIVLLLVGTFLLVWSMNRHLRKLPKSFGDDAGDRDDELAPPSELSGTDPDPPTDGPRREPG